MRALLLLCVVAACNPPRPQKPITAPISTGATTAASASTIVVPLALGETLLASAPVGSESTTTGPMRVTANEAVLPDEPILVTVVGNASFFGGAKSTDITLRLAGPGTSQQQTLRLQAETDGTMLTGRATLRALLVGEYRVTAQQNTEAATTIVRVVPKSLRRAYDVHAETTVGGFKLLARGAVETKAFVVYRGVWRGADGSPSIVDVSEDLSARAEVATYEAQAGGGPQGERYEYHWLSVPGTHGRVWVSISGKLGDEALFQHTRTRFPPVAPAPQPAPAPEPAPAPAPAPDPATPAPTP